MAAATAVAKPIHPIPSASAPHASDHILPNSNPTGIHEVLSTVAAAASTGSGLSTGSGPRVRHGSNQSNHSLRAGFYAAQNRLSRASNPGTVASNGSGRSLNGSFGENPPAYGDHTGTKGWGTGNSYEKSTRDASVPGAYGHSIGTKGFGTGNDFELKRETFNPDLMLVGKSKSRRGSTVSGHSGQFGQSFGSSGSRSRRMSVPASDAVSTMSRASTGSPSLGDKVKAGVEAVTSKFKKSDA